ncbi:1476_t:CDS:2, partial [Acaulospora colombiana]
AQRGAAGDMTNPVNTTICRVHPLARRHGWYPSTTSNAYTSSYAEPQLSDAPLRVGSPDVPNFRGIRRRCK